MAGVQGILSGYMVANALTQGAAQGLITVVLQVLGFIAKKCMLQFADPVNLEVAMLVGGASPLLACGPRIHPLRGLPCAASCCARVLGCGR